MTGSSSLPPEKRLLNLLLTAPVAGDISSNIDTINNTLTDLSDNSNDVFNLNITQLNTSLLKKVVFKHYIFKNMSSTDNFFGLGTGFEVQRVCLGNM